jgi:ribosome-binding factor A
MTSPYESGFARNVFQQLDTECSLCILSLCLASHDIALHSKSIKDSEPEEASYHFAVSLSILREIAKIVETMGSPALTTCFSQKTRDLFQNLKGDLQPFHEDSLTKGTLKPIRDLTFHYDFSGADQTKIGSLLAEIKKEPELRVRANSGDKSVLRYRYTFADAFRSKLVSSYRTKGITNQIAAAAVNIIAFTDSLMFDLSS